ncbi:S53 family peptidase [Martelella alba]|uniref:Peptidase S53 n=1 Tax=Martelella alba TaxID=2590451 RepID=A0ABY2SRA8_9HYPH|nr:S53 family peptidase [Martelella alba]TKI07870.1 peptidase S53 [Martelella alba]
MTQRKHPLAGSERTALAGSHCAGPLEDNERFDISLIIRRPDAAEFKRHLVGLCRDHVNAPSNSAYLSREEYARRFSASPEDREKVRGFARRYQLQMIKDDPVTRTVVLSGTARQFNDAFGIRLQRYTHAAGNFRGRTGAIHLPAELQGIVTAVLGLDNRPQARTHFRFRPPIRPAAQAPESVSYTPLVLAALYDFPAGDGEGQCVAIIELGGGYDESDLQAYFSSLGLPTPSLKTVSVDGGKNSPSGGTDSADGEVMLDIEIIGALAPHATLAVYFAGNSDQGFIDAINSAIHDRVNRPSVVSVSWGGPESSWTAQSLDAFDDALQSAAALGVTVCVASGDSGSGDGVGDGGDHVDFPASSPYALACGGTRLLAADNVIKAETVWNDGGQGGAGGGGISRHFPLPDWQKSLAAARAGGKKTPLTHRGVPDVAGNADPQTGYQVLVRGQHTVVGGTSAVAPLWAGLIARINAAAGQPLGYVQPRLYPAGVCRDITRGDNGDFVAASGWDACTGLGSPDGAKVAARLGQKR